MIMKYFLFLCLLVSPLSHSKLRINFTQPELLVSQVHSFDFAMSTMLNEYEKTLVPVMQSQLKNQSYQALYNELEQKLQGHTPSAAMAYFLGQLALQLTQYEQAKSHFESANQQHPNYAKAIVGEGLAALQLSQYQQALDKFSQALKLGVKDPQLYRYIGFSYLEKKQFLSATIAFEQAKMLLPNVTELDHALVYSYSNSGQKDAALAMLEQLLVTHPNDSKLWLQRANIYLSKEHYGIAISSLETALRLGENQSANIALAAQLQLQYGSTPRAISLYKGLGHSADTTDVVFDAINYLIDTYKLAEAEQVLTSQKNIKVLPDNNQSQYFYLSGKLHQQKGNIDKAQKAFRRAVNLNPIHGSALINLAKLYRKKSNSHQAQMLLLRASEVADVKLQALTEHADLQLAIGNQRRALSLLRQALELAPNEQTLINNVNTLQHMVLQQEN
jgi:tetratricopeptide (TPR) repeat protein